MARCENRTTDYVGTTTPESHGWRDILRSLKTRTGMSGFHLASIGSLGTRGCTALRPGFGLSRPILQLHPDDPSNYPCQRFDHSTTGAAHCMWCRRYRWEKPSCNDGGVVQQLGTGRNQLIIQKLLTLRHDLHPWRSRRYLLCTATPLADEQAPP